MHIVKLSILNCNIIRNYIFIYMDDAIISQAYDWLNLLLGIFMFKKSKIYYICNTIQSLYFGGSILRFRNTKE